MTTTKITVLPHKMVQGWDGDLESVGQVFGAVDVQEALAQSYPADAHFLPYYAEGAEAIPRVNTGAGFQAIQDAGLSLIVGVGLLDVDDPAAHRGDIAEASDQWRNEILFRLAGLEIGYSLGHYMTKRGIRVLWLLPEPLPVEQWVRYMTQAKSWFATHGIHADPMASWAYPYRLPFVVRDGITQQYPAELRFAVLTAPWGVGGDLTPFSGIQEARSSFALPSTIGAGERNTVLMRYAGLLRRRGMAQEEIFALLRHCDAERCSPPMQDSPGGVDELERLARSASRYPVPPQPTTDDDERVVFRHPSEVVLARYVLSVIESGDDCPICYTLGSMWEYKRSLGVWSTLDPHVIKNEVCNLDGALVFVRTDAQGDEIYKPMQMGNVKSKAIHELSCTLRTQPEFFDDAPRGLTFKNGFVQADRDGVHLLPLDAAQRSTYRLPFDFCPDSDPVLFLASLQEIFAPDFDGTEKIRMIVEMIGACLVGDATRFQKAMLWIGDGANGKSYVIDVVSALFNDKTITALAPQEMGSEYRVAMLAGARVNLVNEMPESEILAGSRVKAMITGDKMTGRHIKESPFAFRPRAGHIIAGNKLPPVKDLSPGFFRRWIPVGFNRVFAESEQDRDLSKKIIAQELPAVAAYCLRAYVDLLRRGHHKLAGSSEMLLNTWRLYSDPVAMFLHVATDKGDLLTKHVSAGRVYQQYRLWAQKNGNEIMSKTKFGLRIKKLGVPAARKESGVVYGIQLLRPN